MLTKQSVLAKMPAEFFSTDSTEHGGAMRPFLGRKLSVGVTCDEVREKNHCVLRAALLSLEGDVPTLLATHENTFPPIPDGISSGISSAVHNIRVYFCADPNRVDVHLALGDQYVEHKIIIAPQDLSNREFAAVAKREMRRNFDQTVGTFDISRIRTFRDEYNRKMARNIFVFTKTDLCDEMSEIEKILLNHGHRLRSSASAFIGLLRAFPILVSQGAEIVILVNANQCAVAMLDEKGSLENMRIFPTHQRDRFTPDQNARYLAIEIEIAIAYFNKMKPHGRQACVVVGNNPIANSTIGALRENYGNDFVRPFKIDTGKLDIRNANVDSDLLPFIPAIGLALPQTKGMPRINLLPKGLRGNTWLQRLLHA